MSFSSVNSIIKEVEKSYDIKCSVQREITGGWKNRKWKVHSCLGDVVIKELSHERYSASRLKEVEKALMIQSDISKNLEIVPRIFKADDRIIQEKNNFHYMIMEYIEGVHKNTFSITDRELFILGEALAHIHLMPSKTIYGDSRVLDDHFRNNQEHSKNITIEKIRNNKFYEVCNKVKKITETISVDFFNNLKTGFTHSDFTKDNILFTESDVKILDFDRGRIGYQLQDVGRAIMGFTYEGDSINIDKLKHFIRGYNSIKPITNAEVCKSLRLIWIIEVTWWFHERIFQEGIKDKLKDFREEIIWITNNWESLEDITDMKNLST